MDEMFPQWIYVVTWYVDELNLAKKQGGKKQMYSHLIWQEGNIYQKLQKYLT